MKSLYNNIKINYAFMFVKNMHCTQGIWMLYLASKGLTLFEIGTLEAIFHITSFLMETPTGVVADLFARKTSRIIGVLCAIIAGILMVLSNSYLFFAISFIISALSYNFESGAGEALIYDSLKAESKENKFMKITGNNEVIYQITLVLSLIVGGMVGNIQYTYVFYLAIILSSLSLFIAIFFKEPKKEHETKQKVKSNFINAIKKQYIDSFKAVKENAKLLYLIIFTSILFASSTLAFFYLQIAMKNIGLSTLNIGIYLAITAFFAAIGATFAERIENKLGEIFILKVGPLLMGMLLLLFYFENYVVIPLALISFIEAILYVATRDYINKLITSDKRATILSFDSMMFSFFMILTFPLFGLIGDLISIKNAFLIFGGIITLVAIVNLKLPFTLVNKNK